MLFPANKPELENILNNVVGFAVDCKDSTCQKLAFSILAKAVTAWATNPSAVAVPMVVPGGVPALLPTSQVIPGFEGYIYERLLPICIEVPLNPLFKIKDGQSQLVGLFIPICLRFKRAD